MSNELLTKLMDPLEKFKAVDTDELMCDDEFGEQEHREEICAWAAKWYLDQHLEDWGDFEDEGIEDSDELRDILADNNPEEDFWSGKMECCKNILHAVGVTQIDELESADSDIDFGYVTTKQVGYYIRSHAEEILEKIQEIYAARYEAALKEAADETNESVEQEPEIPEDIKKLRDPLNTADINIFDLMPTPVYGATTVVTKEDFVIWFAKKMVGRRVGLSKQILSDKFYDYHEGLVSEYCDGVDALKIVALLGFPQKISQHDKARGIANASLESFWKINKDKIVSKVKEITKLWLEHGLI